MRVTESKMKSRIVCLQWRTQMTKSQKVAETNHSRRRKQYKICIQKPGKEEAKTFYFLWHLLRLRCPGRQSQSSSYAITGILIFPFTSIAVYISYCFLICLFICQSVLCTLFTLSLCRLAFPVFQWAGLLPPNRSSALMVPSVPASDHLLEYFFSFSTMPMRASPILSLMSFWFPGKCPQYHNISFFLGFRFSCLALAPFCDPIQ